MCDIGYDEDAWSAFNETHHKARKDHPCACCGGTIAAGQRYLRHFSVQDGTVCAERMCLPCESLKEKFGSMHEFASNPSYMPELFQHCAEEERDAADAAVLVGKPDATAEERAHYWETALEEMKARRDARVAGKEV